MKLQKSKPSLSGKLWGYFINALGILATLAIALGGLFLVQNGLAREQEKLLSAGGAVELPPPIAEIEVMDAADAVTYSPLTEEELLQVAADLAGPVDIRLHEPLQGQLSMVQAVECAQTWLEDFLMVYLGVSGLSSEEYRTSCYLWTPETGESDQETRPWLSYWSVSLTNQEIEASFLLNAMSGQILEASVGCTALVEHQSHKDLIALLDAYSASFGVDGDDTIIFSGESGTEFKKLPWYQSVGDNGLYTGMMAASTVSESADDSGILISQELFTIRLYLGLDPETK